MLSCGISILPWEGIQIGPAFASEPLTAVVPARGWYAACQTRARVHTFRVDYFLHVASLADRLLCV